MVKYLKQTSLATATAANSNLPGNHYDDKSQEPEAPPKSPNSKGLNQMEELGSHLDEFVNHEVEAETPTEGEISFGPGHSFFHPLWYSRALMAQDLHMLDLPFIFWALIRILLPPSPSNTTNAMFDALDKFRTKMQEANWKLTVFLHNLSQYESLTSLPLVIDDPD